MTKNSSDMGGRNRGYVSISESGMGGHKVWLVWPALLMSLAAVGGCGSTAASGSDAGAIADTSTTSDAPVVLGTVVRGPIQPCTEAHSICITATFATTMTDPQVSLNIYLFKVTPVTTPPDGQVVKIPSPHLIAGETVQIRATDMNLTDSFHLMAVVNMPGGGTTIPVPGVDYADYTRDAYPFTGAPLNVPEVLTFAYYE